VREKIVHGSDWPILPVPPMKIGLSKCLQMWGESNWVRRDVEIKRCLGFDDAYWQRAGKILLRNNSTR
jgi:hypothetical protein